MQTEIEAKFLNVSHDELRKKLQELGAECVQPMRLMRRAVFDFPNKVLSKKGGWARVRDEGDKVTMSYKQLKDRTVSGTEEVNLTVDNYKNAVDFLENIGLMQKAYQETKRESWRLKDVEIELDLWPWLEPMLEIEAQSDALLKKTAEKLGLNMKSAVHGSVEIVYASVYNVSEEEVCAWPKITFIDIPEWLESKRKRKDN